jgi:hypothetical protein
MPGPKLDAVVEAVHYEADGQIGWVRVYQRRGPTYSDRVLVDRKTLIEHLKSGKRYYSGKRQPLMAGTFDISEPLRLVAKDGKDIVVIGDKEETQDCLTGVPFL